jgi:hypothetical protein
MPAFYPVTAAVLAERRENASGIAGESSEGSIGRIVASVKIDNLADPSRGLRCDALVDTGAAFLVLEDEEKGLDLALAQEQALHRVDLALPQ